MGQIERGFNRIYGIEQDRPTVRKYGRAFLLAIGPACSRVRLLVFTLRARGNAADGTCGTYVAFVRWPIALVSSRGRA